MEDSTIRGHHMSEETFRETLEMTKRVEHLAWSRGIPPIVLLSGGECTENPDFVRLLEIVHNQKLFPILITNGMWMHDKYMREVILRPEWSRMIIQVTNDPRFYPKQPPQIDDPRISFVPAITHLLTLGRAARKKNPGALGLQEKSAPSSFNFRSATRHLKSIEEAIFLLRSRALLGQSGHCIPSVSDNGDVVAGESRFCGKIGTIASSNEELTQATIDLRCNNCGLVDNLSEEARRAIGEDVPVADIGL